MIGEERRKTGTTGTDNGNPIEIEIGTEIEIEGRIKIARTEIWKGIIEIEIGRTIRGETTKIGEMIDISETAIGLPNDRHLEKTVEINSRKADREVVVADRINTGDGKKKEKGISSNNAEISGSTVHPRTRHLTDRKTQIK
jgi:hypothetical protein